jgi:hypothetical protein
MFSMLTGIGTDVPHGRNLLSIVLHISLVRTPVVGFELSSVNHLLPMLHIHNAGSRRVMTNQHIVPLVVINVWICIHYLR